MALENNHKILKAWNNEGLFLTYTTSLLWVMGDSVPRHPESRAHSVSGYTIKCCLLLLLRLGEGKVENYALTLTASVWKGHTSFPITFY